jgi:hypothetical protein
MFYEHTKQRRISARTYASTLVILYIFDIVLQTAARLPCRFLCCCFTMLTTSTACGTMRKVKPTSSFTAATAVAVTLTSSSNLALKPLLLRCCLAFESCCLCNLSKLHPSFCCSNSTPLYTWHLLAAQQKSLRLLELSDLPCSLTGHKHLV